MYFKLGFNPVLEHNSTSSPLKTLSTLPIVPLDPGVDPMLNSTWHSLFFGEVTVAAIQLRGCSPSRKPFASANMRVLLQPAPDLSRRIGCEPEQLSNLYSWAVVTHVPAASQAMNLARSFSQVRKSDVHGRRRRPHWFHWFQHL